MGLMKGKTVSVCRGDFVRKHEGLAVQQPSPETMVIINSSKWKSVG